MIGNIIGLRAGGINVLGNSLDGIRIAGGARGNTVGGTTAATRNIISGNSGRGVLIIDPGSSSNTVQGNYIGLNQGGSTDRGNTLSGIEISNSPNNTMASAKLK